MKLKAAWLAASAIAAAIGTTSASAQEIDRTARRDARIGVAAPLVQTEVEIATAAQDKPFTFSAQLGGSWATNAGFSADDEIEAFYAAPALSLGYERAIDGWTLAASGELSGQLYSEEGDALNEIDAIGAVSAAHAALGGMLTLHHTSTWAYDDSFDEQLYAAHDTGLRYDRSLDFATLTLNAYYSASDDPAQRRTVFLAGLQRTFSAWGADWSLGQSFRVSDFREGANDGRTDIRAKTVFGPTWSIGYGVSAGLQAVYMHNFSNRDAKRFDAFEIGPTIRFASPFG